MPENTVGTENRRRALSAAGVIQDRRPLTERVAGLIQERNGLLPVWVRSPKEGVEHYSGFSRSKLYELQQSGKIRSVSIREPGQVKGTRLFELASILDYIERCAAEATQEAETAA